jgi:hypothetical protein
VGKRTSHLLLLESHVLVVQLAGGLLLGLLVVDGVGTRCITEPSAQRKTRSRWRWRGKASYAPPCPEGILDMWWWGGFSVRFVELSSVRDYFVRAWMGLVAGWAGREGLEKMDRPRRG